MAYFRTFYLRKRLQRRLHTVLAMAAHHAFDIDAARERFLRGSRIASRCLRLSFPISLRAVDITEIQAKRIRYDTETGQTHRRRAEHRIQRQAKSDECSGCQRDSDDIVNKRPKKILMNIPKYGTA